MKLLLDSANLDEVLTMMKTSAIRGVTTNPSLMAKEAKGDYLERLKLIAALVKHPQARDGMSNHLSVEVTTLDPEEMYEQGIKLSRGLVDSGLDVYVKIPATQLPTITRLSDEGVNVNATACMTALQAKLTADAGARIVSFFYNRIKDEASDNPQQTAFETDPKIVLDEFNLIKPPNVKIICGSIRKKENVFDSWIHGADYVTVSTKVIREMIYHPQTEKAVRQFQEDIDRWRS